MTTTASRLLAAAVAALSTVALAGCSAGENAPAEPAAAAGSEWSTTSLDIDFATYNPLSLVIKDQGWLEEELGDDVTVTWTQSAGSNKANEALRAGAIDVGSTAGSAALLARSNGSPIKAIEIYSQPEWAAIVVPTGSEITSVEQLAGKRVAATKGTDPYFFLLQSLEEAGVPLDQVTIENLQHADGKAALENGSVDAWAGLDPLMATSEADAGSTLLYRNIDFNTYGFLNATEDFLEQSPDVAQVVVDTYERAREWAADNPEETAAILAEVAGIDESIATAVLERTNLAVNPVPGEAQRSVLEVVGPIFVDSGDVADQAAIDAALESLFEPVYAEEASAG
ncbi:aliphatic sulfonate ABC transporter substrate-binding protein [Desertivibrio insolitus]|uniref:aliphatic sulfonate ABC transporter substrate-binding protein n=1 Tax=Herbiconiux sp. SYSU D00978 TaxID=2812562 RepID=UPI001A97C005|nr:aliphatic sulfonate ABC transporter substrate-binding protein [Herbiconiux sp. SYSU D00978]